MLKLWHKHQSLEIMIQCRGGLLFLQRSLIHSSNLQFSGLISAVTYGLHFVTAVSSSRSFGPAQVIHSSI